MSEGFIRQRRNLIISCLILLLLSLADVQISKFSLLGIEFNFSSNKNLTYYLVWIVWFYFLYRYFVYFMGEGPTEISKTWVKTFEDTINKKIKAIVYSEHKNPNDGCGYSYLTTKRNNYIYKGQAFNITKNDDGKEEKTTINYELPLNRFLVFRWELVATLKFLFLTKALTDYVLGFLISVFVLIIASIAKWQGNLVDLIT